MTPMLNFEELKVLVVEDNKPMQVLIKSILNAIRIKNIHLCQDGAEAFKEIGRRYFRGDTNDAPDVDHCR